MQRLGTIKIQCRIEYNRKIVLETKPYPVFADVQFQSNWNILMSFLFHKIKNEGCFRVKQHYVQ